MPGTLEAGEQDVERADDFVPVLGDVCNGVLEFFTRNGSNKLRHQHKKRTVNI